MLFSTLCIEDKFFTLNKSSKKEIIHEKEIVINIDSEDKHELENFKLNLLNFLIGIYTTQTKLSEL